jgi:O-acetyl-ADP-ribose deacetylase
MEINVGTAKIQLIQGDITDMEVDAIVNAANPSLMGGGGVDGAIHAKGGPKILEECKYIRQHEWTDGLLTGQAVITSGGNLKAKHVIHTVGTIWRGGFQEEAKQLKMAYRNSLKLAAQKGLKTMAFPSISTGTYGYPTEEAAKVAIKTVRDFLQSEVGLERVVFVLFSKRDFDIYVNALKGFC